MSDVNEFIHGIDGKAAREFLKELGVYEIVIKKSPVGDTDFAVIIAANEYLKEKQDKK